MWFMKENLVLGDVKIVTMSWYWWILVAVTDAAILLVNTAEHSVTVCLKRSTRLWRLDINTLKITVARFKNHWNSGAHK